MLVQNQSPTTKKKCCTTMDTVRTRKKWQFNTVTKCYPLTFNRRPCNFMWQRNSSSLTERYCSVDAYMKHLSYRGCSTYNGTLSWIECQKSLACSIVPTGALSERADLVLNPLCKSRISGRPLSSKEHRKEVGAQIKSIRFVFEEFLFAVSQETMPLDWLLYSNMRARSFLHRLL